MRYQGRITNWNDDKGYGFVTPNGGGEKAFVHITAFSNSHRRPTESDLITYELATDQQHRLQAGSIRFVGDPNSSSAPSGNKSVGAIFATLFCCFVVTVSIIGKLSFAVPFLYAMASTITFMVYAFDKAAAFQNRWRTQERTLHLLGWRLAWCTCRTENASSQIKERGFSIRFLDNRLFKLFRTRMVANRNRRFISL